VFTGEHNREGFALILSSSCDATFKFATLFRVEGITGGECWECNLAAVWGKMATDGGHTPLGSNGHTWDDEESIHER